MISYVFINDDNRVVSYPGMENAGYPGVKITNAEIWDDHFREDTTEFRVEGDQLIYDPTEQHDRDYEIFMRDDLADIQSAICELYEMMIGE